MTLKELSIQVGAKIRERRQIAKLTQAQLAEGIAKSSNYVGLIERGDRIPSLNTVLDISTTLGVSVQHFFAFDKAEPRSDRERAIRQLVGYLGTRSVDDIEALVGVAQALNRHYGKGSRGRKS